MSAAVPVVRFWTDLDLVRPTNTVHFVVPFSPPALEFSATSSRRRDLSAQWWATAEQHYRRVDRVEDSDIAVLPFAWEDTVSDAGLRAAAKTFAARAAAAGRATFVFCYHDRMLPVALPETVVFRFSLWRSRSTSTDVAMPGWVADPLAGRELTPLSAGSPPSVGFCGFAPPLGVEVPGGFAGIAARSKATVRHTLSRAGVAERLGLVPTLVHRVDAIRRLQRDPRVHADFLLRRDGFSVDEHGMTSRDRAVDAERYRSDYVDNLLRNPYTLAVRGFGNFSYRFYEALAAGRTPVTVDTDIVLPLADSIDWPALSVVVPAGRARRLPDAVLSDAARFDDDAWAARQSLSRRTWQESLTMSGFFAEIHRRLVSARDRQPVTGAAAAHRVAAVVRGL